MRQKQTAQYKTHYILATKYPGEMDPPMGKRPGRYLF